MKKCEHCGATYLHRHADDCPNRQPEDVRAITDVIEERQRQIRAEGWTPEHDDGHTEGALAAAAACFALEGTFMDYDSAFPRLELPDGLPVAWPWHSIHWKPKDRRRNLVRAAALIVAEIERLDRQEAQSREGGGNA